MRTNTALVHSTKQVLSRSSLPSHLPKSNITTTTALFLHHRPQLTQTRAISAYGYTQSKALLFTTHGEPSSVLNLHTHSISPPHGSLLTLRTLAAPLNPADINQIQGTYPSKAAFATTLGTAQPSAVPGNEAVFEVLAAGSGVKGVQKGDWVIPARTGLGTWRTHIQTESDRVMRVEKEGLKPVDAATVSVNPLTAWRMLRDFVALEPGRDWFIQNGANSGVGRAALQLGKLWGLKSIAVVRGRPGEEGEALKQELLALGATRVVTEEEVQTGEFAAKVKGWMSESGTSGSAVRLALNCVGGRAGVALAKVLAPGGCMVTYGAMSKQPLALPAGLLIFKNLRFEGFWVSKWGDQNPEDKRKCIDEVLQLVRDGKFKMGPTVDVPWEWKTSQEELVSAVQGTLEGYRSGKGVLIFGET